MMHFKFESETDLIIKYIHILIFFLQYRKFGSDALSEGKNTTLPTHPILLAIPSIQVHMFCFPLFSFVRISNFVRGSSKFLAFTF